MRPIDADALLDRAICTRNYFEIKSLIERMPTIAPPPNDPLTLEELRELGKDWVWIKLLVPLYRVETGYYVKHKKFSSEDRFCCGYPDIVMRDLSYADYGCDWLAYRRKPEEGMP